MIGDRLINEVDNAAAFGFVTVTANYSDDGVGGVADADFIAHARTDLPAALDQLEHWKANHDEQVAKKQRLSERYETLLAERNELKSELAARDAADFTNGEIAQDAEGMFRLRARERWEAAESELVNVRAGYDTTITMLRNCVDSLLRAEDGREAAEVLGGRLAKELAQAETLLNAGNPPLAEFLEWLGGRLEHIYGESPNIDFVRACHRHAYEIRKFLAREDQK